MEKCQHKRGLLLLVVGILLILIAGGWYVFNLWEDRSAGQQAEVLLEELNAQIGSLPSDSKMSFEQDESATSQISQTEQALCGKILIGKLGVELPVYQDWNYEKLRHAPCRYSGSMDGDDMIVAAHNYKSHFRDLKELDVNDSVLFVDAMGVVHYFAVKEVITLDGSDVEDMTSGEWDFTLFTCTKGGEQRVTVRCDRIE